VNAPVAPLDDPSYVPKHPPVNGVVPWVVAKWGARSQLRWFRRFEGQLRRQVWSSFWEPYFIDSEQHRGRCCSSCVADIEDGYDYYDPDRCCCWADEGRWS
jgi:hypothetical protein